MAESDLFFRIKMGEEILRAGAIPTRNLFSFTYPDAPDRDLAWLFDVAAAAIFSVAGFRGVVLGKTLILTVVFAAAFAVCRRRGAGAAASAAALAAAALVMRDRLVERPHIFSFAGEVMVLALMCAADREGTRSRRRRLTVVFAAAMAAWANLHAGVFIAPLLLVLYAAGASLDRRATVAGTSTPASAPRPWRALRLAGVAAAALLLTPAGAAIFQYLRFHTDIFALHPVDEFRAPDPVSDGPLLAYAVVTVVAVISAGRSIPWRHVLPVLGAAVLAGRSVRFGADFALLAAPLLAARLTALGTRIPSPFATAVSVRGGAILGAWLAGAAAGPRFAAARAGSPWLDVGLDESTVPLEAIRFADVNGLRERMYNDFEIGSYLAFDGYPRHRVFIDPRLPAYPIDLHRVMGRGDLTRAEWDATLDRYGVQSALLAYAGINRRVAWFGPERWALVYRKADARVFVRRLSRWRALIAAREIPATFSFTEQEGTATLPLFDRPAASPVADCEWQQRLGDLLFDLDGGGLDRALPAYRRALAAPAGCLPPEVEADARAWVAAVDLGAGDLEAAVAGFDRVLALAPHDLSARTNRAVALAKLGRLDEARAEWRRIAAAAAGTPLGRRAASFLGGGP